MNAIRHVVVLGLMGSGKTSVGRELAAKLGWPLSDSDEVIEREQRATVRELGGRLGVEAMHALEADHLLLALNEPSPSVVSAAGSVVDRADCRAAVSRPEVFSVWLDVNADLLTARFAQGIHRPVLDPDLERMFRTQMAERSRWFAQLADYRTREDHGDAASVAAEVAEMLATRAR